MAQAVGDESGDKEDYRALLREVDEVAEPKRIVLDVTEPAEQSRMTT